ncbi:MULTISPECIES: hypothetical protein [unclassified Massilia]|uniref:hypothetical protein n=1 Tax=unclassified Massilia TaxID=2609279 RepID=UPI001780C32B|nr:MULTISPECIES: hypothetical protein [unclassified Massilia]MBD8531479.1 hypothetical protein [Massilia sp. CFBP 13647]MBD8673725.1 hypothetical protein [Massilia sp. CFBP 13721]
MPKLTTIAEWAKLVGISRQSAYDAVDRCEIPVTDGKVDAEYATHRYETNTRKRAKGNKPDLLANGAQPSSVAGAGGAGGAEAPAKIPGYDSSRARREAAEAAVAEIKLAEMAGLYLLKADVDSVVFEVARALRDGLMNYGRRVAADVAPLTTADECEAVIDRETRTLLESMVHTFSEKLAIQIEDALE